MQSGMGMIQEDLKYVVLRHIAQHDGQLSWYQVDRAFLGLRPRYAPSFRVEIRELAAAGLIEIPPNPALDEFDRYWLTDKGRSAILNALRQDE